MDGIPLQAPPLMEDSSHALPETRTVASEEGEVEVQKNKEKEGEWLPT